MGSTEKPWKLVAAFSFFGLGSIALLIPIVLGYAPFASLTGVMLLLCAGFPVAGCALLPAVARQRPAVPGPNALSWTFIFAGLALWSAAPIIALYAGTGWTAVVGGGGRAMPIWALAIIVWGTTGLVIYAFVRQRIRARRRQGGRG